MQVLYMSYGGAFGEHNAVMSLDELKEFITENCDEGQNPEYLMGSITTAWENDYVWYGDIGPHLVIIATLDYVRTMLEGPQ